MNAKCSLFSLAPLAASLYVLPLSAAADRPPIEQPLFEQIQDINPCTGELITLTFTGVARIHQFADHYTLHGSGIVSTSDGWVGTFNRQFVFHGDRVQTLRFHDTELNAETGQRIIFGVGLAHVTSVNGTPVVDLVQFSGARCVGKP